jgi:(3R)-3-hydroxyacyl-CoA dehydrogenase / 3a,7a,12a-trihydroxy-5b-cholest-24-enoyl-CoA hydratase / enoyl-CoA hydratase 2
MVKKYENSTKFKSYLYLNVIFLKYLLKVRSKWNEITSFANPIYHTTIGDSTNHCINAASGNLENAVETSSSAAIELSTIDENKYCYDFKDILLYNLSLGISTANEANLKFLYENHADFCVMPSFGVIPAFQILTNFIGQQAASNQIPHNVQIDPAKLLHGEHYLEIFKTIKCPSGVLVLKPKIVDVLDKGSGAALIINVDLIEEKTQDLVARNQFVTFLVGSGNFGGKRDSDELVKLATKQNKDEKAHATLEEKTTVDQAALYRLNGDFNPLHIDPSFSK